MCLFIVINLFLSHAFIPRYDLNIMTIIIKFWYSFFMFPWLWLYSLFLCYFCIKFYYIIVVRVVFVYFFPSVFPATSSVSTLEGYIRMSNRETSDECYNPDLVRIENRRGSVHLFFDFCFFPKKLTCQIHSTINNESTDIKPSGKISRRKVIKLQS